MNQPTVESRNQQPAVIVTEGVPGRSEPYAELADGRTMPMGWSAGKTYRVGQKGTAAYVMTGMCGLWQFTPDPEEDD